MNVLQQRFVLFHRSRQASIFLASLCYIGSVSKYSEETSLLFFLEGQIDYAQGCALLRSRWVGPGACQRGRDRHCCPVMFPLYLVSCPGSSLNNCCRVLYQGTASQAAEKLISAEGDGLQAAHNCFEMNSALAAEGLPFDCAVNAEKYLGLQAPEAFGFSPICPVEFISEIPGHHTRSSIQLVFISLAAQCVMLLVLNWNGTVIDRPRVRSLDLMSFSCRMPASCTVQASPRAI